MTKEPSHARADLRVSRTGCVQRGDERHRSERNLPETLDHSRQVDRKARRFTCAPVDRRGYLPNSRFPWQRLSDPDVYIPPDSLNYTGFTLATDRGRLI